MCWCFCLHRAAQTAAHMLLNSLQLIHVCIAVWEYKTTGHIDWWPLTAADEILQCYYRRFHVTIRLLD
jgi:hypothetical protein